MDNAITQLNKIYNNGLVVFRYFNVKMFQRRPLIWITHFHKSFRCISFTAHTENASLNWQKNNSSGQGI